MKDKLIAKLELLKKERDAAIANINAYGGAIQVVELLLKELEEEAKLVGITVEEKVVGAAEQVVAAVESKL